MPPTTKSKKSKSSSPAPAATAPAHEPTLEDYALRLLHLTSHGNIQQIKKIFELGAPAWYQEESTGWSCLHFAAHRGDWEIVKLCLDNGAVWNSADLLGRTAGDIALSLNDEKSYILIRNEGIRQGKSAWMNQVLLLIGMLILRHIPYSTSFRNDSSCYCIYQNLKSRPTKAIDVCSGLVWIRQRG